MLWYKILGRTDGNIATKKGVLTIEKRPLFWETGRAVLADFWCSQHKHVWRKQVLQYSVGIVLQYITKQSKQ